MASVYDVDKVYYDEFGSFIVEPEDDLGSLYQPLVPTMCRTCGDLILPVAYDRKYIDGPLICIGCESRSIKITTEVMRVKSSD